MILEDMGMFIYFIDFCYTHHTVILMNNAHLREGVNL
jgi:hypothetical protein